MWDFASWVQQFLQHFSQQPQVPTQQPPVPHPLPTAEPIVGSQTLWDLLKWWGIGWKPPVRPQNEPLRLGGVIASLL